MLRSLFHEIRFISCSGGFAISIISYAFVNNGAREKISILEGETGYAGHTIIADDAGRRRAHALLTTPRVVGRKRSASGSRRTGVIHHALEAARPS